MNIYGTDKAIKRYNDICRLERRLKEHEDKYKAVQHKINFLTKILNWVYCLDK